jgi:hypothetical protein
VGGWVLQVAVFLQECCNDATALCSLLQKMQVIKSVEVLHLTTGAGLILLLWESTFICLVHLNGRYIPKQ